MRKPDIICFNCWEYNSTVKKIIISGLQNFLNNNTSTCVPIHLNSLQSLIIIDWGYLIQPVKNTWKKI